MNESQLGSRILALRTEQGLTQEEAAEKLGVSGKTLSKWETGATSPDIETVMRMAAFFGVTTDDLLGLSDRRPPVFADAVREEFAAQPENPADALLGMHEEIVSVSRDYLYNDGKAEKRWTPVSRHPQYPRRVVNCQSVCQMTVGSPENSLSFALFRNESGFSWLEDEEKRAGIAELFAALGDPDALRVCRELFDVGSPACFTAETIAAKTGIDAEKAAQILGSVLGMAGKETARLREGEREIWQANPRAEILFLIALAYEFRFGRNANEIGCHADVRLIGGDDE